MGTGDGGSDDPQSDRPKHPAAPGVPGAAEVVLKTRICLPVQLSETTGGGR